MEGAVLAAPPSDSAPEDSSSWVEIIDPGGLTHVTRIYRCGDIEKEPDARLLELAQPGTLHLGKQVCRFYDPDQTAAEREAELYKLQSREYPSLDKVKAAATHYGYVVVATSNLQDYEGEMKALHARLSAAQDEIAVLHSELYQLSHPSKDPDNGEMIAAIDSVVGGDTATAGVAPAGDPAEVAAPPIVRKRRH